MNRPLAILAVAVVSFVGLSAREQGQTREFTISGNDHHYSPARLEVNRDDLVKITFTAVDMPHSFNNERYRIAKRAGAGQSVTFEFRADQAGSFEFYCNLKQDERCRDMKGTLVVVEGNRYARTTTTAVAATSARAAEMRSLVHGRMRVEQEERRVRRTLLGEILRGHPPHCTDERRGFGRRLQREAVGPALVSPRPGVQERRGEEHDARDAQHQHGQTRYVSG